MFDDLNNFFEKSWNIFNRPVHDMMPYKAYRKDQSTYIIIVNTLGIAADQVKVTVEKAGKRTPYPVLKVSGQTKLENINFENNVDIGITLRIQDEIESVNYKVADGLTVVQLKLEPKKDNLIEATLSNDLDW